MSFERECLRIKNNASMISALRFGFLGSTGSSTCVGEAERLEGFVPVTVLA
jgi:hypothetical protein